MRHVQKRTSVGGLLPPPLPFVVVVVVPARTSRLICLSSSCVLRRFRRAASARRYGVFFRSANATVTSVRGYGESLGDLTVEQGFDRSVGERFTFDQLLILDGFLATFEFVE